LGTNKLVAGHTYTLTATPDAGQQFIGWKGSIKSSNPKLTFVAKKDMDVEADFAPGNFTPDNNTYYGLFYETDKVEQNSSGALSIRSTSRGTYTGKVQMSGHSYGFSVKYDGQGAATNNVMRGIQRPLTLVFHFGVGAQADQVYGTVADGTWLAVLSGERAAFNRLNPAPFAGNYTLIIPGQSGDKSVPAGDGFGAIRVTTSGGAVFSGSLADGTKVTQSAGLAKDGSWPFYASMYAGNGSLVSWLTISKQPDATPDITGLMSWIKQSGSPSKAYLSGFTTEAHAVGAVYARPSNPSQHIIGLNSAEIAFTDGDLLDAPFTNSIPIDASWSTIAPLGFAFNCSMMPGS